MTRLNNYSSSFFLNKCYIFSNLSILFAIKGERVIMVLFASSKGK